jgi:hypothetical protein
VPLDPSIIASIGAKPPEAPNLFAQYGQLQQIRQNQLALAAQQQAQGMQRIKEQAAQLEYSQQQLAAQEQQQAAAVLARNQGDVQKSLPELRATGNRQALVLEKHQQDIEKEAAAIKASLATAEKNKSDAAQKNLTMLGGMLESVQKAPPAVRGLFYQARRQQAIAQGLVPPDLLPEVYDEAQLSALAASTIGAKDQRQLAETGALHGAQETHWQAQTQQAQTAASQLEAYRKAQLANQQQRLGLQGARVRSGGQGAPAASGGTLSPQALDNAATLYNQTTQLPPLGMGKQGAAVRAQILNRAAELAGPTNVAANKADYQANAGSLRKLVQMRDAVTAFESTATKNLDLFLEQAKGVVDSGSPLLNLPLRMAAAKVAGSPQQLAYEAARQVAINEIAKVTSNPNLTGALTESARREVAAFAPESATLKQVYAVAKVLKQDMANRHGDLNRQISTVQGQLRGEKGPEKTDVAPDIQEQIRKGLPKGAKILSIKKVSD